LNQQLKNWKAAKQFLYGLELNHVDNAYWQFPIKYNIHRLGKDGQIILLGRDLQINIRKSTKVCQSSNSLKKALKKKES
jgi:hypothetical protein